MVPSVEEGKIVLIANPVSKSGRGAVAASEAARLLRLAIQNELTERQRACLTLYYIEGHTMQEIAELLGTTRGNVSKRIKNAVERLRRALRYSAPGLKFSR